MSKTAQSGSKSTRPGQTKLDPKWKELNFSKVKESSRKRKKNLPSGPMGARSSGSTFTTLLAGPLSSQKALPDYEKFVVIQKNF